MQLLTQFCVSYSSNCREPYVSAERRFAVESRDFYCEILYEAGIQYSIPKIQSCKKEGIFLKLSCLASCISENIKVNQERGSVMKKMLFLSRQYHSRDICLLEICKLDSL